MGTGGWVIQRQGETWIREVWTMTGYAQQVGREGSMNSPQKQGAAAPIPPQTSPGNDPMTYNKCNWQKHYKDK